MRLNQWNEHFRTTAQALLLALLTLLALSIPAATASGAPAADNHVKLLDADITQAIEVELIADPAVMPYGIDISTKDGIVMLEGTASNLLSRERAGQIASSVRGVRGVINRVTVDGRNRSDRNIQTDVEYALAEDRATESWEIRPRVQNAVVTLTGTVDSWAEKRLAAQVASGVIGVREVENKLEIEDVMERPDAELRAEIERRQEMDVWVGSMLIDVAVNDGVVTLSGSVGSDIERARATTNAWVAGVKDVDATALEVEDWVRDRNRRGSMHAMPDDDEIQATVRDALSYDPRLKSFDPGVAVMRGTVTLTGLVDNLGAKIAAEDDARNVLGVQRVHNFIKVRQVDAPADALLEQRVERALVRDPFVHPYDITVNVDAGIVTLRGEVQVPFERQRAARLAARVGGTVHVKNMLTTPVVYDPLAYRTLPPPYADTSPRKSDTEIAEDIRDQLFWSPFVDADQVHVTVVNGVATLSGVVNSPSERDAAHDNAFDGGAVAVNDDLMVEPSGRVARPESK